MTSTIPHPPRRLLTRIVLPVTLVAASAGALLWTGWRSFVPVPTVDVVPVSLRAGAGTANGNSSDRNDPSAKPTVKREGAPVQAPGWIEPSPFAVMVPALTPGVVLARLAVPGMIGGGMQDGKPLIELYDPSQLQVRADVPLADAGRIAIGDRAEVTVEVLPDRTFRAEVIRVVHQADIAKNTVQAKVRIIDPDAALKPEMLARVKLFPQMPGGSGGSGNAPSSSGTDTASNMSAGQGNFWINDDCVDTSTTPPSVLLIAGLEDGRGTIERRAIGTIGESEHGWRPVASGLRAGDLAVKNPLSAPKPGTRVRVTESWRQANTTEGAQHEHH